MSKKSHTPPCQRQSKSPSAVGFRSVSRKDILWIRPHHKRENISGSRSASRLNNQSERGHAKSYRNQNKENTKQFSSLNKKKESFSNAEITVLVNQFQNLKTAYEDLLETKRKQSQHMNYTEQIMDQNMRYKRQNQKLRNQNEYYRQQFQRIKKECIKLIEIEGFKIKRLEETLQEKQLMLQYLRNQNMPLQGNIFLHSTPVFKSPENPQKQLPTNLSLLSLQEISAIEIVERNNFFVSSIHGENRVTISSDDSLVFSKDRSKSNNIYLESVHLSPPSLKEQISALNRVEMNCPTFDIKELEGDRIQLIADDRPKKKHLKIDTDTKSLMNPTTRSDDDLITNSTKKRINIPTSKDQSENISHIQNVERKKTKAKKHENNIQKIDVSLPNKDKKSISIKHHKGIK